MAERKGVSVDLTGKTAVVTGATRGIGEAIVLALAENGATVVVNYRKSADRARELVERFKALNQQAFAVQADVSVAVEANGMIAKARELVGGAIDILVNNVGTQLFQQKVEEMRVEQWRRVFDINLVSAVVCAKAVIPDMKKQNWGRIINITSISGNSGGSPGIAHYASSKAAMHAFTKGLAKEVGPDGITVNAIAPGVILTDLHTEFSTAENLAGAKKQTALQRLGEPVDIAGAVIFLASESASYMTGETIAINGGLRMD